MYIFPIVKKSFSHTTYKMSTMSCHATEIFPCTALAGPKPKKTCFNAVCLHLYLCVCVNSVINCFLSISIFLKHTSTLILVLHFTRAFKFIQMCLYWPVDIPFFTWTQTLWRGTEKERQRIGVVASCRYQCCSFCRYFILLNCFSTFCSLIFSFFFLFWKLFETNVSKK